MFGHSSDTARVAYLSWQTLIGYWHVATGTNETSPQILYHPLAYIVLTNEEMQRNRRREKLKRKKEAGDELVIARKDGQGNGEEGIVLVIKVRGV